MKKTILGLRTVIYKVADLGKAKDWYSRVFATQPYFDEPFYVGFNVGGFELGLQPEANAGISIADNVQTYWGVDDVSSEFERMLSLGATEHEKPQNVGGEIVVASLRDPGGNVIGIIYNPEFKPD